MINLRKIPAVDEILVQTEVKDYIKKYRREFILDLIREATGELRRDLLTVEEELDSQELLQRTLRKLQTKVSQAGRGTLQKVINGTGVVLHTNMGRAPLGKPAVDYMAEMAQNYNNLELNLDEGKRGSRYWHVEEILSRLTGAEAALVVNNNAAAVMLGLNSMAEGREVIVSRGQLVEIGGAFRIPEVMKLSGARLVEVGTTNKTYISDYSDAINEETALLFAAHTSNYKIIGFSEEVELDKLAKLGKERQIPVMQDLGSGVLMDMTAWGLKDEPMVQECVASGVDIISFSGDKLLGGPQAGIIVGKKKYIEAMKKNQLLRALRVDKLTIAALEGTLVEYLMGNPEDSIPVIHMLKMGREELYRKARVLCDKLQERIGSLERVEDISLLELEDMVGGGAYPTYKLPGFGVKIGFSELHLDNLSRKLRLQNPALLSRRQDGKMLISVRTILDGDEDLLINMLAEVLQKENKRG